MRNSLVIFGFALALGAGMAFGDRYLQASPGEETADGPGDPRAQRPALVPNRSQSAGPEAQSFPAIAEDCITRNNEATSLLAAGELLAAVELFRICVEEDPEQVTYRRNLFEALARLARFAVETEHDLALGIECLTEAIALEVERPDRGDLELLLERWRREWEIASNDLVEPSLYFELAYDPDREDLLYRAQEVMDLLDRAYVEMTEWFLVDPVRKSGRKIRVTFYDNEEFDRVTGLGDWAGGVFDGTIRLAVNQLGVETERWSRVARHELVHAFIRELGGDHVPGWLNEGLAQWLDYSSFPNSRRSEQVKNARARLAGSELFSFTQLTGSLSTWQDRDAIARAYAESLSIVAFIDRYYGRDALIHMVARAREEGGIESAFRDRTGVDLSTILIDLGQELAR